MKAALKQVIKCGRCGTVKQAHADRCPKCKKVPGEQLEDAPFNNKIMHRGKDSEGHLTASDSEGNHYCWCPEDGGYYVWGLTLEQKVKMDGLDSVPKDEQREYVRERAEKANRARWDKQRKEDATRTGLRN